MTTSRMVLICIAFEVDSSSVTCMLHSPPFLVALREKISVYTEGWCSLKCCHRLVVLLSMACTLFPQDRQSGLLCSVVKFFPLSWLLFQIPSTLLFVFFYLRMHAHETRTMADIFFVSVLAWAEHNAKRTIIFNSTIHNRRFLKLRFNRRTG